MAKKEPKHSISSVKHGATKALQEFKVPGLIILGMVGGNMAGKLIDKVIKPDPNATGLKNAKNLIRPVIQISAGLAGRVLLKDENLKLIATGVAVGGVFSGVKVLLKKDLLAGLTGVNGLGETEDQVQQVFREPLSLAIEPYTPDLPRLPEAQMAALPVETESEITGTDLGEYEEVKEISFV